MPSKRDEAQSALFGLLVSTAVFTVSFAAVVEFSNSRDTGSAQADQVVLETQAQGLADLSLRTTGIGWYPDWACQDDLLDLSELFPDYVSRFGLAEEACGPAKLLGEPNALDYLKLHNIRWSPSPASLTLGTNFTDNYASYEETQDSLGLRTAGVAFQLKFRPLLHDDEIALDPKKREVYAKPLLIGRYNYYEGEPPYCANPTPGQTGQTLNNLLNQVPHWQELCDELVNGGDPPPGYWDVENATLGATMILDYLVSSFDVGTSNETFETGPIPYDPGGDILPDNQSALLEALPQLLRTGAGDATVEKYNMIVIAPGVANDALDDGLLQGLLTDWVNAGGMLYIFRSDLEDPNWMLSVADATLDHPVLPHSTSVPDPLDPALTVPYKLQTNTYETRGAAWIINPLSVDKYRRVALADYGGLPDLNNDVLSISNFKAFGDGRIVLSAWDPYNLTATPGIDYCDYGNLSEACESVRFWKNLLTIVFDDLTFEYGEAAPRESMAAVKISMVNVLHPGLDQVLPLRVQVTVHATSPKEALVHPVPNYPPNPLSGPDAPTGLTALPGLGAGEIDLTWVAPVNNGGSAVTNYRISRGDASGTETFLTEIGNVLTHTDTGLPNAATRYYKVSAVNAVGEGAQSNEAFAATLPGPLAPVLPVATQGSGAGEISLTWQAPANAAASFVTGYKIYRGNTSGSETYLAQVGNVLTFLDTGLPNGATRYYKVSAVNAGGEGPLSAETSATTKDAPGAPATLTATAGLGKITLVWTVPASDGGSSVTNYKIYRGTTSGSEVFLTQVGNVLTFDDTPLSGGSTRYYKVSAVNAIGEGTLSVEKSATAL